MINTLKTRKVGSRPRRINRISIEKPDDLQAFFATQTIRTDSEGWFAKEWAQLSARLRELKLPEFGRWLEFDQKDLSYWRYRDKLPGTLTFETIGRGLTRTSGYLCNHPVHSEPWYLGMLGVLLGHLWNACKANDTARSVANAKTYGGLQREYAIRFDIEVHYAKMNRAQEKRDAALDRLNASRKQTAGDWHTIVDQLLLRYPEDPMDNNSAAARYVLSHWPKGSIDPPRFGTVRKYIGPLPGIA